MTSGARAKLSRYSRRHWKLLSFLAVLIVLALSLDYLIDEPIRRYLVREANQRVKGYKVEIPRVDFRPWLLSGEIFDVRFIQEAHPEPPVADVGRISLDLDWTALFGGRVVGDSVIDRPRLHIDTAQLREEWNDEVAFEDRGWQLLFDLYPLKINVLKIRDASLKYIDSESQRDLEIDRFMLDARNIRQVTDGDERYPSPVKMSGRAFEQGKFELKGDANFLLKPHAGFNVVAAADGVPLGALGKLVDDYHVQLKGGVFSARGQVEIAPEKYIANMQRVRVDGLQVDYVAGATTPKIAAARREVEEAARYADKSPALRFRAGSLDVNGSFGYVSETDPKYRIYLDKAAIRLTNFSNRAGQGESILTADGLFMGSGKTSVRGVLRPGSGPTDFVLDAQVRGTELTALNDVLRAHGKLDVSSGSFSVFSQFQARDGQVRGYVKPLFSDIEVYDAEDDADKNVMRKLYEKIVEGVAKILENTPRDEVATVVDISGPLKDPNASTLQIIGGLLRNAFIDAILPGFDARRAVAPSRKRPDAGSESAQDAAPKSRQKADTKSGETSDQRPAQKSDPKSDQKSDPKSKPKPASTDKSAKQPAN